jgi:hypothetical protein
LTCTSGLGPREGRRRPAAAGKGRLRDAEWLRREPGIGTEAVVVAGGMTMNAVVGDCGGRG